MTSRASSSRPSDAAIEVARGLLARGASPQADDGLLPAGAERICAQVIDGLARSFGPFGARTLVERALARAKLDHPSLNGVTCTAAQPPEVTGLVESARANGVAAVMEGAVALLATLTDAIGRLIGDDLAVKLIEQSIPPSADARSVSTDAVPHLVTDQ